MSVKTVEERLDALEARVTDGLNLLHNVSFPELDAEIDKIRQDGYDTISKAREFYDAAVIEINNAAAGVRDLVADVRHTKISLRDTVASLIIRSGPKVLLDALVDALRSTILVTRPASRIEAQRKDTLVVRPATAAEIREQKLRSQTGDS
jgi:hypothetical protein